MNRSPKIILIIDDDPTIRKLISYNLKKEGYEIFEADGAKTGFEQLNKLLPDLVLCDIMMNEMDGFEFVEKIRQENKFKALPFIFVSAKSSIEDKSKASNLGADDFISKPFRMEDLNLKVRTLLKRSEIYKSYGMNFEPESFSADSKGKILIVDDDKFLLTKLKAVIEKENFVVFTAENAIDGFDLAKRNYPDLIMSDIIMPNIDGFEFKRLLNSDIDLKSIPFVFLTAKSDDKDLLAGYQEGIYDYILKSINFEIIVKKIIALVNTLINERKKVVQEFQQMANEQKIKAVPEVPLSIKDYVIEQIHLPYLNIPGGDFIDYLKINEDLDAIVIGDLMGKKQKAWYYAMAFIGYIRNVLRFVTLSTTAENSPASILSKLNSLVYNDLKTSDIFTTTSVLIIDNKKNLIKYSGAGDLPLLQKKAQTNEIIRIKSDGILLGIEETVNYQDVNIKMDVNDEILIATDGITEARNSQNNLFGFERLEELLLQNKDMTFQNILIDRLKEFTNNSLDDDLTALWIKRVH